jgi:excisionase family DNA binding protein
MNQVMDERHTKIQPQHLERAAYVYVRQSSPRQVIEHLESQRRQYDLVNWAGAGGWPSERIVVIDEDQGKSGSTAKTRPGFARLIAAVAQGEVGIVIALEVTRLSRNSPDWHHLLYLCRFTNTLIADEHTVYDPDLSTDRLVLGIRGQMSEMELDTSIERMVSARWSKAARGELYTIPPAGYDIDERGQWVKSSDESIVHALVTVFEKLDELGSARQVFAWWRDQGLQYPVRRLRSRRHPVVWLAPTYAMFLRTFHNPIYTGTYVFGRSKSVRCLDAEGVVRTRAQRVKRDDWPVVIYDHHDAYIPYDQFVRNEERLRGNVTMHGTDKHGPAREGAALLQGLVLCGHCGRRMSLSYGGSTRARVYQYRCSRARAQHGGSDCQVIGGKRIDQTVVEVFLEATTPCAADAARLANEEAHRESEALRLYWAHQIERVQYEAQRAERQYMAVEPENRVVARELERRWEQALKELECVRTEAGQAVDSPELLSVVDLEKVHLLGQELRAVWNDDTTTNRDRKRLLRCLIEEVQLSTGEDHYAVRIVWKGGATTERELVRGPAGWARRTPEDTVELVRRLAAQFDDAQIARILNKQGRRSGRDIPFTKAAITSLRGKNKIPTCAKIAITDPRQGPFNAEQAARELGVTMSTVHRWLRDGVLAGEQLTAGAPWQIVLTDEIRERLAGAQAPEGWVGVSEAARRLGVSKSLVTYWVKSGKLAAVRVTVGKRRCWKIDIESATCGQQHDIFEQ